MATIVKREAGQPLSELFDWFDAGWPPALAEWRRGTLQPIRIEDRLEDNRYVVSAELPGIDPEKDVEITVTDGLLTITAERKEESTERGRSEFRYGSFRRTVTLPKGAQEEAVKASYRDGILQVELPVSTARPEARKVKVARG